MTISLGQNIDSLAAQRALGQFTSSLTQSYTRLSSGLRINQASDDAAGLSIVSQLNSHARVFTQAIRNVNDAVSVSSIAEGALSALKTISQRQLELAEEAANGTYSTKQRQSLNTEANALVDEYNRIVSTTTFNGLSLLDPSLGTVLIQAGYGQAGALQLNLSNQLGRAVGNGTFQAAKTTQAEGTGQYSVTLGDLNGDGLSDLVTADSSGTSQLMSVYLSNGDGTFKAAKTFQAGGVGPYSVTLGDLNGDGRPDLVVADTNGSTQEVSVFLSNGDGTFKAGKTFQPGNVGPYTVTLGDLNGDGRPDLVMADTNGTTQDVNVFLSNGDGTFQDGMTFQAGGTGPDSVSIGDLNGDGKLDLVTADLYGNDVSVFLGNGNGTFQAAKSFQTGGGRPNSVSLGDLNGDGQLDLVTADYLNSDVSVFLGNGNGTFQAAKTFQTLGGHADFVSLGDLNGDGQLDLVTADSTVGKVSVLLNNGNGTFKAAKTFQTGGTGTNFVSLGDQNGDGRIDVVTVDALSSDVSVLFANGTSTSTSPYLNLNSQQYARDALNTVTANLNRVEAQLGAIGATTSRFQAELGNLQTETENFDAAAGRIQDTDVAQETANLTRTQILQQAAASVLAQANQQPGLALKLLGG